MKVCSHLGACRLELLPALFGVSRALPCFDLCLLGARRTSDLCDLDGRFRQTSLNQAQLRPGRRFVLVPAELRGALERPPGQRSSVLPPPSPPPQRDSGNELRAHVLQGPCFVRGLRRNLPRRAAPQPAPGSPRSSRLPRLRRNGLVSPGSSSRLKRGAGRGRAGSFSLRCTLGAPRPIARLCRRFEPPLQNSARRSRFPRPSSAPATAAALAPGRRMLPALPLSGLRPGAAYERPRAPSPLCPMLLAARRASASADSAGRSSLPPSRPATQRPVRGRRGRRRRGSMTTANLAQGRAPTVVGNLKSRPLFRRELFRANLRAARLGLAVALVARCRPRRRWGICPRASFERPRSMARWARRNGRPTRASRRRAWPGALPVSDAPARLVTLCPTFRSLRKKPRSELRRLDGRAPLKLFHCLKIALLLGERSLAIFERL